MARPPAKPTEPTYRSPSEPEQVPRPVGRALSSAEFWTLMARWKVSDQVALDLIGFPGKVGKSGKRPRFRFSTKQRRITSYLAEIDAALDAIGRDPSWLHRCSRAALSGQSPIDHMINSGESGVAEVLRVLNRAAMKAAGEIGRELAIG